MNVEVAIIGGGVNGLALARELADRHGASVAVFDDRSLSAASRAAAGVLGAQIEAANLPVRQRASTFQLLREGRTLHEGLNLYARDFAPQGTGYRRAGALHVALDEAELEAIEARYAWQRAFGVEVVPVSSQAARRLEPSLSSFIAGGVYLPEEALVDPALLMFALRRACHALGVRSVNERVVRVDSGGGRALGVRTGERMYAADVVVMAAGGWTAGLEGLPRQLAPIKAQPARTMLLRGGRPLEHVVLSERNYIVPWENGTVAVSSNADASGAQQGPLATLYAAATVMPAIASRSVWHTRLGYRPHTPSALPWLGPTEMDGLFVMTGNVRNGLLLAPAAASLLANLIDGRSQAVGGLSPGGGRGSPEGAARRDEPGQLARFTPAPRAFAASEPPGARATSRAPSNASTVTYPPSATIRLDREAPAGAALAAMARRSPTG